MEIQSLSSGERRQALLDVASALLESEELIKAENEIDVQAALQSKISASLIARLTLKPGKVPMKRSYVPLLLSGIRALFISRLGLHLLGRSIATLHLQVA